MKVLPQSKMNEVMVQQAQWFTRKGRAMSAWDLIQAEDLGKLMLQSPDWNIQGIGKHLIRFVNRILFEQV